MSLCATDWFFERVFGCSWSDLVLVQAGRFKDPTFIIGSEDGVVYDSFPKSGNSWWKINKTFQYPEGAMFFYAKNPTESGHWYACVGEESPLCSRDVSDCERKSMIKGMWKFENV